MVNLIAAPSVEEQELGGRPHWTERDFAFSGSAEGIDLTQLDSFLRAYLGVDAQRGRSTSTASSARGVATSAAT